MEECPSDTAGGAGEGLPFGREQVSHLEELAIRLRSDGWYVHLATPCGRAPYVQVINPVLMALNDEITAAPMPGTAGRPPWCFWWSFGERIARTDALDLAAVRIAKVLGVRGRGAGPRRTLTSPMSRMAGGVRNAGI